MGGLTKDGHFERTDIWREGKWVDLWCAVHLLSGVSIGVAAPAFKFFFSVEQSIVIVLLMLVAYELWEAVVKIDETIQNRIMDVVVGMISFVPVYFFTYDMSGWSRAMLFAPVLAANSGLAALGWWASQKADVLEANLRAKWLKRRERRELKRQRKLALREAQNRKANPHLTKAPQEVS